MRHFAWIGLGANQGDAPANLGNALRALEGREGVTVAARSSLYRTEPWGDPDQPAFANAVAGLACEMPPLELLHLLQAVEHQLGRLRDGRRWGPRAIDLDLLLYDRLEYSSAELVLPHPRLHERAFVLVPLLECAPDLDIPGQGLASDCLARVGAAGVERLEQPW